MLSSWLDGMFVLPTLAWCVLLMTLQLDDVVSCQHARKEVVPSRNGLCLTKECFYAGATLHSIDTWGVCLSPFTGARNKNRNTGFTVPLKVTLAFGWCLFIRPY